LHRHNLNGGLVLLLAGIAARGAGSAAASAGLDGIRARILQLELAHHHITDLGARARAALRGLALAASHQADLFTADTLEFLLSLSLNEHGLLSGHDGLLLLLAQRNSGGCFHLSKVGGER